MEVDNRGAVLSRAGMTARASFRWHVIVSGSPISRASLTPKLPPGFPRPAFFIRAFAADAPLLWIHRR